MKSSPLAKRFQSYIEEHALFNRSDKILLAISGGMDSVVCFHLLRDTGYRPDLAHCNFQLRGSESDADEQFVIKLGEESGVRVHHIRFNTDTYAKENGISVQMAARNLRYEWFEHLRHENGYDAVILAHHADDSAETTLINLVRGTGISGLTGIAEKSGAICRPLLFAAREEIESYVRLNQIPYREDSSNSRFDYMRNHIRHLVIPELKKLNPSFREAIEKASRNLRMDQAVLKYYLDQIRTEIVFKTDGQIRIRMEPLRSHPQKEWILFHLLSEFGFHPDQSAMAAEWLDGQPGRQLFSENYELTADRQELIICFRHSPEQTNCVIREGDREILHPLHLRIRIMDAADYRIPPDPAIASLDYDHVSFPLSLSHWREGDRFQPLGMANYQKISDFFIDQKLPRPQKKQMWILRSDEHILWVVGMRIDHRFRITPSTRKVLQISLTAEC